MTTPTAHVPAPALEMREGIPVSSVFDDVYFSRGGAIAETQHVFLKGNGLPQRWMEKEAFTICELGFGTGLNFLVTMQSFRQTAHAQAGLHYIAIEKFPFTPEQLRTLLAQQPELAEEAKVLLASYPLRLPGIHRVQMGKVTLTLCFGDATEMLNELVFCAGAYPPYATTSLTPAATQASNEVDNGRVDAWYLDGFSPAKNADMWSDAIYEQMRRLSAPGASVATFTAASHVRRGLEAAGFAVTKTKGFGHKRDMLVAVYEGGKGSLAHEGAHYPLEEPPARQKAPSMAIVIGAGIAGATLAYALAQRGYAVTVLERTWVASGASGNAAGVLFPQITKQWGTPSAWYFTAYGYALRQLHDWQSQGLKFEHVTCGMLRLPRHAEEESLLQQLQATHGLDARIAHWLSREDASEKASVALQTGGAFFPEGTWLNPERLCTALLAHEHITVREATPVQSITRTGAVWRIMLEHGEALEAPLCCVTAAHETAALLADYGITLGRVGGQVSAFSASDTASPLRSILCHSGYVIPANGQLVVGATYHRDDFVAVTEARHEENRAALTAILPHSPTLKVIGGRSSIRATTPDRMPYVGGLDEGLYIATGFGSRGLLSAPLAAQIIASHIVEESPPVTEALRRAVSPHRLKKA